MFPQITVLLCHRLLAIPTSYPTSVLHSLCPQLDFRFSHQPSPPPSTPLPEPEVQKASPTSLLSLTMLSLHGLLPSAIILPTPSYQICPLPSSLPSGSWLRPLFITFCLVYCYACFKTYLPAFTNLHPAVTAVFLKCILIMFLLVQKLLVASQQLQGNLCFCMPTIPNPMWFPGMTLSPQVQGPLLFPSPAMSFQAYWLGQFLLILQDLA